MPHVIDQIWPKRGWMILLGIALFHLVAWAVKDGPWTALVLGLVFVGTVALTWLSPRAGLLLAFLEVIVGGHGTLVSLSHFGLPVSLRMTIFGAVMAVWGVSILARRIALPRLNTLRDAPLGLLCVAIALGFGIGFLSHAQGAVIDDANSYLFLLYLLPAFSLSWTPLDRQKLLQTIVIGTAWVSLFTLILVFAFTHLDQEQIWYLYKFVRDTRLFEVTLLSGDLIAHSLFDRPWYFRVFGPSQYFAFTSSFVLLALFFWSIVKGGTHVSWRAWMLLGLFLSTVLASLSRSFWLGFIVALVVLFIVAATAMRVQMRMWAEFFAKTALTGAGAILLLWLLLIFPLRPDLRSSPFYRGEEDVTRSLAVSSRYKMLGPLMEEIEHSPILGSGFGEEVTFETDDPRLQDINGTSTVTSYRFEWGFHDIWLKMGVLGLTAFLVLFVVYGIVLWRGSRLPQGWLSAGLLAMAVFLYVTHSFSPYLNHPIGLMSLVLIPLLVDFPRNILTPPALTVPVTSPLPPRVRLTGVRMRKGTHG